MIDQLIQWDKDLLVVLNGFHVSWLDPVMLLITKIYFWLPLYAFLIYLMFRNFKKQAWFILIGAALTLLLCDQITATFMKPFFARLRPSHDPSMQGLLHYVDDYKEDLYGFSSGHAANTFGIAVFIWLTLRPIYQWTGLIFIWAMLMSYSRIYLGVHFPGDIAVGIAIGIGCGLIGFKASQYMRARHNIKNSPPVADDVSIN
jgi:undecaprenyl-diphosphatase